MSSLSAADPRGDGVAVHLLRKPDIDAFARVTPQRLQTDPEGRYQLFRIGDAVASRNIHAAVYDAIRLMKDV